jgi:hypothetical protein
MAFSEITTSVTGFINKCVDNAVPTLTVHTFPNQKPRITGNIHTELKLPLSRRGTLTRTVRRNLATPSKNHQTGKVSIED